MARGIFAIDAAADAGVPTLLRNGLYNVGGQTVRGAVGLLTIPFLIRLLGIREYGVWSLAYAILALVTMSEAGMSMAAAVFLSKDFARDNFTEASRTLTFILISAVLLSTLLVLLLWLAGPLVVRPLGAFGAEEKAVVERALQFGGVAAAFLVLQRTMVGVEQAFNRYATINVLDFAQSVLANAGVVLVAWLGGRTVAMMEWQVLASAALFGAHSYVVYRLLHGKEVSLEWSGEKAWRMLRYCGSTWISTLGSGAFANCDRLIVGGVLGAPLLGIYSAITGIASKINSFSGAAVQPLVPLLSCHADTKSPSEDRIRQATHLNALIAIEAGIFLYVMAAWVMRVIAPGATSARDIVGLQIAAVIYALYSLNAPGHFILFALGEPSTNAIVTLSSAALSLVLIFLGAHYLGLLGALAGNVGYLGTLFLIALGLKKVGVALRHYLAWMAVPSLGLATALFVWIGLQEHFWWRAGFIILQGAIFLLWFFRTHASNSWVRSRSGHVSENYGKEVAPRSAGMAVRARNGVLDFQEGIAEGECKEKP